MSVINFLYKFRWKRYKLIACETIQLTVREDILVSENVEC